MLQTKKIYLDYNATTPVDPRVLEAMIPYFSEKFGNASSITHAWGWDAEEAVELARTQVASLIGAKKKEVYFTSGATEAINLALFGVVKANSGKRNHIITCVTEHSAVLETCRELELQGCDITYLPVDQDGAIDLDDLRNSVRSETVLISLMTANNEIGTIHPIQEIAAIAREYRIPFFTDATQAVGKIPFDVEKLGVDMAAFSAHKVYGPKGVGALYIRDGSVVLAGHLFGGKQERGIRPGTLNVPGIVGFGEACELCAAEMDAEATRLRELRDRIEHELVNACEIQINGQASPRLSHVTNLSFEDIDGTRLIRSLKHLAVSQGSACTSVTLEPSHVLKALGHSDELALSSLRISLGRPTTEEEVVMAIGQIKDVIEELRLIPK